MPEELSSELQLLSKQLRRTVKVFDKAVHRNENYDWVSDGRPILWKELINAHGYLCGVDMGAGLDLLFYRNGKTWNANRHGVFLDDVVFLTDNHGYSEGALFLRDRY